MPFGASSRNRSRVNPDGTHYVRCYLCTRFICLTTAPITRALCAVCEASEQGVIWSDEVIRQYELSRAEAADVSMLLLEENAPVSLPGAKKRVGLSDFYSRAIGFLRKVAGPAGEAEKLAVSKRRGKLLEGLVSGDMEEVDAKLKDRDR